MHEIRQKIVCLVPSWTETLLECGAEVVGRSRFCIHPADRVKDIPAVGGTKDFRLQEILNLKPAIVILDKEENRKEMAEALSAHGIQLEISHVDGIESANWPEALVRGCHRSDAHGPSGRDDTDGGAADRHA